MTRAQAQPATFDPLEQGFAESPYEQYARLRATNPVHRSDLLHGWVVTRFDDVGKLLRDPSISSSVHNATPTPLTINEIERLTEQPRAARTVVLIDDPDHARIRSLMADPFRPRQIERLRRSVTERVGAVLDALRDERGAGTVEIDLVSDFAYPLPVQVFSEMLGVPEEDHPRFRYWTQCVARSIDPIMSEEEREESLRRARRDVPLPRGPGRPEAGRADRRPHVAPGHRRGRRRAPVARGPHGPARDPLHGRPRAHRGARWATACWPCCARPDQLRRLRAQPDLLRNAIAELLRYDGPNQFVRRVTTRPTVVGDVELAGGEVIYASLASANRDPDRWGDTADEVRVDRPDATQHLQFGAGVHACLGSHLARLQAEIMFTALLERLDDIELAGDPEWSIRMFIRGLNSLPIRCTIA